MMSANYSVHKENVLLILELYIYIYIYQTPVTILVVT
jgi:hypothetical protein